MGASLSVHNTRYCANRACLVIIFRQVIRNACPVCGKPGDVVEAMTIERKKD